MESEINLLRKNIGRLVENEIKPKVKDWEKEGKIPDAIFNKLAELGMFGLTIPEEQGGIGYGAEVVAAAVEELARGSASVALLVLIQNSLIGQTLIRAEKTELLPQLAEGKILGGGGIFDSQLTETDGKLTGQGDFLINGLGKIFVLGSAHNAFLIQDGIELNPCHDVLAFHAADICSFILRDAPIIYSATADQIRPVFDLYLLGISAIALGIAREVLYEAKTYARNRKQFGHIIIDFWMVQDMVAEIATTVRASELLIRDLAQRYDQERIEDYDSALVKSFVTNRIMDAATLGIQIFGGYGYTTDYPMERYFREAKALEVLGQVNEELRSRIAQSI